MLKTIQSSSQREDRVGATWHQPKHMACGGMHHRRAKKCGPANAWFNSKLGSRILDSRNHRNHRLRENLVDFK